MFTHHVCCVCLYLSLHVLHFACLIVLCHFQCHTARKPRFTGWWTRYSYHEQIILAPMGQRSHVIFSDYSTVYYINWTPPPPPPFPHTHTHIYTQVFSYYLTLHPSVPLNKCSCVNIKEWILWRGMHSSHCRKLIVDPYYSFMSSMTLCWQKIRCADHCGGSWLRAIAKCWRYMCALREYGECIEVWAFSFTYLHLVQVLMQEMYNELRVMADIKPLSKHKRRTQYYW